MVTGLTWQQSLLAAGDDVEIDPSFAGLERQALPPDAWVDHVPGWVTGADTLLADLAGSLEWLESSRWMYDRRVRDPRLHARRGSIDRDRADIAGMVAALSGRYGIEFRSVGANLYRDGRDSVAWHGDRVARDLPDAVIAIVSLGAPRRFLLRPKGGGPSVRYDLRSGDLLVMGGSCQRTWDHSVPKTAVAGARISITFRHRYDD
jgi:alkylated DNA repair dioxygenase AlkB